MKDDLLTSLWCYNWPLCLHLTSFWCVLSWPKQKCVHTKEIAFFLGMSCSGWGMCVDSVSAFLSSMPPASFEWTKTNVSWMGWRSLKTLFCSVISFTPVCLCVQVCPYDLSVSVCSWLKFTLCYLLHLCEMKWAQIQAAALSSFPTVIGAICFGCVNIVSGMLRSIIHDLFYYCEQEQQMSLSEPN